MPVAQFGKRPDGSEKGLGYFGPLQTKDKKVMTELSVGINLDGKDVQIPTVVPTLSKQDMDSLLGGNEPSREIVDKAVSHALGRMNSGLPLYATPDEEGSYSFGKDGKVVARPRKGR